MKLIFRGLAGLLLVGGCGMFLYGRLSAHDEPLIWCGLAILLAGVLVWAVSFAVAKGNRPKAKAVKYVAGQRVHHEN